MHGSWRSSRATFGPTSAADPSRISPRAPFVTDAGRRRVSGRAILVVLGCMMCQMGAGWFYATKALSPNVIAELAWTRGIWSSGMAPMILVSSLAQAGVGAACLRFGVRPVVSLAIVSLALSVVLLATMRDVLQFYLAMMLLALGNAGIGDVAIGGVVTRWFDRHRSLALGCAMVGANLGAVLFIQALDAVPPDRSWREAALIVGLGGLAAILPFALFVVRDPRARAGEGELVSEAGEPGTEHGERAGVDLDLRAAMRGAPFWILSYTVFCYSFVQLGLIDHLVLYALDLGYSEREAADALALTVGAGILAKLGAGVIALRVPARSALLANTGVLALSLVLVPFASDPRLLHVSGLLFGLSTAARDVLLPLALATCFGARFFAQIYGAMMIAFIPGAVLGPLVLAQVHAWAGHYRPGFVGGVALLGVAFLAIRQLPEESARERD